VRASSLTWPTPSRLLLTTPSAPIYGAQPPQYDLFDQVWLGPELAKRQIGAFILQRSKLTHDGTDHDPAWVTLTL
jgi:hypothetical protein